MTKADLVKDIVRNAGGTLNATQAEAFLDALGESARMCLSNGGEMPLPGIGKLKTKRRAAREGRNPRTGAPVQIPAKTAVTFTVGKALKEALA